MALAATTRALLVVAALAVGLFGCSDDIEPDATVTPGAASPGAGSAATLVADFSYDVDLDATGGTSCPAVGVTFTDESRGDPTGWEWGFGDGTTSDQQDPQRTVGPENGEEVTLTVTRGAQNDTVTMDITYSVC